MTAVGVSRTVRVNWVVAVMGVLGLLATSGTLPALPVSSSRLAYGGTVALPQPGEGETVAEPAAEIDVTADRRKVSLRHRVAQWLPRVGVFLMAMVILGFLAVSALFSPPFWAWFIYLFLLPFFVWLSGMTLHPAAGWAIGSLWLVAFPLLRWWMHRTPSGNRWRQRQERRIARFGAGDADRGSWRWTGSLRSRGSARSGRSGTSSGFSGRGGRFGGGGASGRW